MFHKKIVANIVFTDFSHLMQVWPWPIYDKKIRAQALIGIHYRATFENDVLKTVDTRLLTNRQMDKQTNNILPPFGGRKNSHAEHV